MAENEQGTGRGVSGASSMLHPSRVIKSVDRGERGLAIPGRTGSQVSLAGSNDNLW